MTMHDEEFCIALSEQARAAIKAGNAQALKDMYADDAEIYLHLINSSKQNWSIIEETLEKIFEMAASIDYRDVKITPTKVGFIQQYTIVINKKSGGEGVMSAVILFTLNEDGKFAKMEEYGDMSGLM